MVAIHRCSGAGPAGDSARDGSNHAISVGWRSRLGEGIARAAATGEPAPEMLQFRWWIEELAVALFAQELKTPFPVSAKRLERRWAELAGH